MLFRTALFIITGLVLAGTTTASEKPTFQPTLICPVQTNWTRLLAADGTFKGPPAINALIVNVIDNKLPQVRRQLDTMTPANAAHWRQSALIIAAYARNAAMVAALLDDGALVDGQGTLPGLDRKSRDRVILRMRKDRQWASYNPDLNAAIESDSPLAALLFDSRLDGPVTTIAAQCNDLTTLDVALNHHANLKARIPHSNDVMVLAVLADNPVIVKRLLDNGADPTNADGDSSDGLIAAIVHGNAAMVTLLLDHGANPCTEYRNRQHRIDANQIMHHKQNMALPTDAEIGRSKNLPDDLVARLTCPAFDTASINVH